MKKLRNPLFLLAFSTALSSSAAKAELIPDISKLTSDYITLTATTEEEKSANYIVLYDVDNTTWTITPKYYDLSINKTDYTYQTGEKTFTYDIGLPETVTITAGYTTSDERQYNPDPIPENLLIAEKTGDWGGAIEMHTAGWGDGELKNGTLIANSATNGGGAIILRYGALSKGIIDSVFLGNTAPWGGAIFNQEVINPIENTVFIANKSDNAGGVLYQNAPGGDFDDYVGDIINSFFLGNTAGTYGGVIRSAGIVSNIKSSLFLSNSSGTHSGVIYNGGELGSIEDSIFIANKAQTYAGVIYNNGELGKIENSIFIENTAGTLGGVICNRGELEKIENSTFIANVAETSSGGAIYNYAPLSEINSSSFIANSAGKWGGALYNADGIIPLLSDSIFINNSASWGGAVGNWSNDGENGRIEEIRNSTFINNGASEQGGAIFIETADSVIGNIKNSTFLNNTAGNQGGAIYSPNDLLITSDAGTTLFQGNTAGGESNAIYMDNAEKTLTFDHKNGGQTYMYDAISGADGYNVVIKGADKAADKMYLFNDIKNAGNVTLSSIQLNLINNDIHGYHFNTLTVADAINLAVDVDLNTKTMDTLSADTFAFGDDGAIDVNEIHIVADATGDIGTKTTVSFMPTTVDLSNISTSVTEAIGSVYTYSVVFNAETGEFEFTTSGLAPEPDPVGPTEEEMVAGETSSIVAGVTQAIISSVATQTINHGTSVVSGLNSGDAQTLSTWVQVFGSEDDVELKHMSQKVDAQFHGVIGGVDSKRFAYDNGVNAIYGVYGAYTKSKQKLNGNKIDQKGGYLGLSAALRKGAFFNNVTLNGGYLKNEANTKFGKDKFDTKVVSLANKTGIDLKHGELTFTPALVLSYMGIDTDDYTTKSGVKVENKFMNVFTVAPELKVAKDFGDGLNGYVKTAYKMFFYDNNKVKVDSALLPSMSVKPYVEYGVGLTKDWSQTEWNAHDISSFAEIIRHDGGREGWNVNLGLKLDF